MQQGRVRLRAGHGRLVIAHRHGTREGHIAGVSDEIAVADALTDCIVGCRSRSLDQREGRFLVRGDGLIVFVEVSAVG